MVNEGLKTVLYGYRTTALQGEGIRPEGQVMTCAAPHHCPARLLRVGIENPDRESQGILYFRTIC